MFKQYFALTILFAVILSFSSQLASANSLSSLNGLAPNLVGFPSNSLQIKRGQRYDETKDPALRRGTENWEQDQGSYFAIPALVIGVVGLLMFFTRNKD